MNNVNIKRAWDLVTNIMKKGFAKPNCAETVKRAAAIGGERKLPTWQTSVAQYGKATTSRRKKSIEQ